MLISIRLVFNLRTQIKNWFSLRFSYQLIIAMFAACFALNAYAGEDLSITQQTRLANAGNANAQLMLGAMYSLGQGVRQDNAVARQWYEKAANQGSANAQLVLGMMYEEGSGVRQDYAIAQQWYEKAANQGNAFAQYNLGGMYGNGNGVRQDYAVAKEFFGKACDNGHQKGCDAYKKLNTR